MTRQEFMGQFDRLCTGFKHDPTAEQGEAWFRRVGLVALSVWAEAVTTLLCAKYFPKLEEVQKAIDEEAERQRKAAIDRDKPLAHRIYAQVQKGEPQGCPFSKELFEVIRATAGREQVRAMMARLPDDPDLEPEQIERRMEKLRQEEDRLSRVLTSTMPKLSEQELTEYLQRYRERVPV